MSSSWAGFWETEKNRKHFKVSEESQGSVSGRAGAGKASCRCRSGEIWAGFKEIGKRVREEISNQLRDLGRCFGGGLGKVTFLVAIELEKFGRGWRRAGRASGRLKKGLG